MFYPFWNTTPAAGVLIIPAEPFQAAMDAAMGYRGGEERDSPGERNSRLHLDITCPDPRIRGKVSKTHTLIFPRPTANYRVLYDLWIIPGTLL